MTPAEIIRRLRERIAARKARNRETPNRTGRDK